jgi:hypothetical protein
VSRLIDEISKRRDYIDAQAAKAAKAKAEHEARAAKQWLAVQLLAKAIGAQAVKKRYPGYKGADYVKWDQHEAAVIADGYSLEVNEEALDNIIATFGKEADNGTISDHFRPGGIYHNNETETENN